MSSKKNWKDISNIRNNIRKNGVWKFMWLPHWMYKVREKYVSQGWKVTVRDGDKETSSTLLENLNLYPSNDKESLRILSPNIFFSHCVNEIKLLLLREYYIYWTDWQYLEGHCYFVWKYAKTETIIQPVCYPHSPVSWDNIFFCFIFYKFFCTCVSWA